MEADGRSVGAVPGVTFAVPGDAGYTLGPRCARIAADLVVGRRRPVDPVPYAPDRLGRVA